MSQIDETAKSHNGNVEVRVFSSHLRDYTGGIYPEFIANNLEEAGLSGNFSVNIGQRIKGTSNTLGLRITGKAKDEHSLILRIHPPKLGNKGCRFGYLIIPQELNPNQVALSLGCDFINQPIEQATNETPRFTQDFSKSPSDIKGIKKELQELRQYCSDEEVLAMILMEMQSVIDNISNGRATPIEDLPQYKFKAVLSASGIINFAPRLNQYQISQIVCYALTKDRESEPFLVRVKNQKGGTIAYHITSEGKNLITKCSSKKTSAVTEDEAGILSSLLHLKEKAEKCREIRNQLEELGKEKNQCQSRLMEIENLISDTQSLLETFVPAETLFSEITQELIKIR